MSTSPRSQHALNVSRRAFVGSGLAVAAGAGLATGPSTAQAAGKDRASWINATMAKMTTEQLVGQLFVMHVYGSDADVADQRNVPDYGVAKPSEVVEKYRLGGVIYFAWAGNLPTAVQCAKLSNGLQKASLTPRRREAQVPLTISTDQETGIVVRLPAEATLFPGAMSLGAGRDTQLTTDTYAITGTELRALGINVDYAPDADVNVNPANPVIGVRSFSSNPQLVADHVAAGVAGLQSAKVSACAKHFPGHGDTDVDSHTGFPVITHTRQEWEEIDAPPFRAAIDMGIDSIMTAHLAVPALDASGDPATLSKPILTGVLRDELGYDGVVVTDSLGMAGVREKYGDAEVAVKAIEAGVDVLLNSPAADVQWNAVLNAVRTGRISKRRLETSVRRILGMKYDRGLHESPYVDVDKVSSVIGAADHQARAQQAGDRAVTLLVDDAGLVPLPQKTAYVTGAGDSSVAALAAGLTAAGITTTSQGTGTSPTARQISQAVVASARASATIVLTNNVNAAQKSLITTLIDAGRKVIVVAVRNPYDINQLPGVGSYLATYSSTPVAMKGVARVLAGTIPAAGRLPVDIPAADDPTKTLYPYGAGLDR
ncbi:glycoside hydrolase family 3 N-terminal domain-containing protein [Propionibacteriaceae bacterium Y1700]|uniref:glycoside hydrolase family 3 protein n=1 Tax=Microlunatus sp. Y1700 TaxID=3418487 RepID=UPI003DA736E6